MKFMGLSLVRIGFSLPDKINQFKLNIIQFGSVCRMVIWFGFKYDGIGILSLYIYMSGVTLRYCSCSFFLFWLGTNRM